MTITARPVPEEGQNASTVLVVVPDAKEGERLVRALDDAGLPARLAVDGGRAIDELVRSPFEVLVIDGDMTELPAKDLVSVVRAYDIEVPIIVMTRNAAPWVGAGVAVIGKPVEGADLARAVKRSTKSRSDTKRLQKQRASEAPQGAPEGLRFVLDRALDELFVAFQPIMQKGSDSVFAYEALMRSREPKMSTPMQILSAAEQLGRLDELGRRVRSVAAKSFSDAPDDALLFVNLHSNDLLDESLYDSSTPLSSVASRVVLEITERATIEHVDDVPARLSVLRFHGFRVAIDDLGAGYAGLTSFATVEPEFVKLDMSLVRNVHSSPVRRRLVGSMLEACRDLGTSVIAEGIEGTEELRALADLGCELYQGYLFARPATLFERPKRVLP